MMGRMPAEKRRQSLFELLLMLFLLFIFAASALIVVVIGADVYANINRNMNANYDLRIPLSYVSNKIRQADSEGAVSLQTKEGTTVLVLASVNNGSNYETWIYEYEGYLYEVLYEQGKGLPLEAGTPVIPVNGFSMKMEAGNLMTLTAKDTSGKSLDLRLALRSDGEEGLL
jgi:hypothetical protein